MYRLILPFFLLQIVNIQGIDFDKAADEIIQAGIFLNQYRLCPATGGNFSHRIDGDLIAITASGKHKGELTPNDVLIANLCGKVQENTKKPSAETALHTMLYSFSSEIGAVLHTHSTNGIILSRMLDSALITEGYEIHKVFPGFTTHKSQVVTPIFENSQDIPTLAAEIKSYLRQNPQTYGFLIRGHGFYTWGKDMKEARYRIEAFEQLFECELKLKEIKNA